MATSIGMRADGCTSGDGHGEGHDCVCDEVVVKTWEEQRVTQDALDAGHAQVRRFVPFVCFL